MLKKKTAKQPRPELPMLRIPSRGQCRNALLALCGIFSLASTGCGPGEITLKDGDEKDDTGIISPTDDADGDGRTREVDCDDTDASVYPGADEICDGVDNDCDGNVDNEPVDGQVYYADLDADGYGDPDVEEQACDVPAGYVEDDTDCDDGDAAYNPGADEACTDAEDYNCDGSVAFADLDGDGVAACEDCDDNLESVFPGAEESYNGVDDNCDGLVDNETEYYDDDGDGYTELDGDCNDADAAVNPEAVEIWYDGVDQDCNDGSDYDADDDGYDSESYGGSDCADGDAAYNPGADEACDGTVDYNCDGSTGEADADGDGFVACEDCDDSNADVSPDDIEMCDGIDNNCDGATDDWTSADAVPIYVDADGDGYGSTDPTGSVIACEVSSGYAASSDDCDDSTVLVNPGAAELCDELDNDCDGTVDPDSSADASTWYVDADGDAYGDAATTAVACTQPDGYAEQDGDCDETRSDVNPGAAEVCDGDTDEDCDGTVDEDVDLDADGYTTCDGDCDDGNATAFPGADEYCNEVDDDCDGTVDEDDAVDAGDWYPDADGDGDGAEGSTAITACNEPAGYSSKELDCNDGDASVSSDAAEVCDDVDNNCDGTVDEPSADTTRWHADTDGDGFGDAAVYSDACDAPTGYVASPDDCDDADGTAYPGADEECDGVDDDCDGTVDETTDCYDDDGDGETEDAGDCDDGDSDVNTAATEVCDGADNDCDDSVDEYVATTYFADADGDGYGDPDVSMDDCSLQPGWSEDDTDCDDTTALANPGYTNETDAGTYACDDFVDNDCDASATSATGQEWDYGDELDCPTSSGFVANGPNLLVDGSFDSGDGEWSDYPTGYSSDDTATVIGSSNTSTYALDVGVGDDYSLTITQTSVGDWYEEAGCASFSDLTVGDTVLVTFYARTHMTGNIRFGTTWLDASEVSSTELDLMPSSGEYTVPSRAQTTWGHREVDFTIGEADSTFCFGGGEVPVGDTLRFDQVSIRPAN